MKKLNFIILLLIISTYQYSNSQWAKCFNGLSQTKIYCSALQGNTIWAGTKSGLFKTTDSGINWYPANNGPNNLSVISIAVSGNYIALIALSDNFFCLPRIFLSSDNGISWKIIYNGSLVNSLAMEGNILLVGYDGGVGMTTDFGETWCRIDKGFATVGILTVAIKEKIIYAAADYRIYRSSDLGESWEWINNNLTKYYDVFTIEIDGKNIFAGTTGPEILLSADNGKNWKVIYSNSDWGVVTSIKTDGTNIIAGGYDLGILISTDYGNTWKEKNDGLTNNFIHDILIYQNTFLTSTDAGIFNSTNYGETWEPSNDIVADEQINTIAVGDNINIICGTKGGNIALFNGYRTSNTWGFINGGLQMGKIHSIAITFINIVMATDSGVFVSTDFGIDWASANNSIPSKVNSLTINKNNFFAGTDEGIFISSDNGINWNKSMFNLKTNIIYSPLNNNNILAGTDEGIFLSTDNGSNWESINTNLPELKVTSLGISDSSFFLGCDKGVFLSLDSGKHWTSVNNDLPNLNITSIAPRQKNIFVGTSDGVFLSTNLGTNWNLINKGLSNIDITSLIICNFNLFAGTNGDGVFRAKLTDFGITSIMEEVKENISIELFPNPVEDNITILINDNESNYHIKIMDLLGNNVKEYLSLGNKTTINLVSLATGIYFIRVGNLSRMFVKQ